jgi:hypothetical protein
MCWRLGLGDKTIEIPGHGDIAAAAHDVFRGYGEPWRYQPDEDWRVAERKAFEMLSGFLFMKLGDKRLTAEPLAVKLLGFSLDAHRLWWGECGMYNGYAQHSEPTAEYFLAAMGSHLLRGPGGARLMRDPSQWPVHGYSTRERLAHAFWEARMRVHGRDVQDTELAAWVLAWTKQAHKVSTHPGAGAYLQALGYQLFADPQGTVNVFYA